MAATDKPNVTEKPTVETTYPLSHHLNELRKRIMYIGIFVVIVFGFCYWKSFFIYDFIMAPISPLLGENTQLTLLKLTEGFLTELKLALMAAIFFSMPFILYQFWKFVAPGLYKDERRYLAGFVFSATFLFLAGSSFAYFVVFPLGFKFFLSFVDPARNIIGTFSIAWYLSLATKLLIAFGVVFELPVIIFFLTKIGLVNTDMLKKYRKFAIVGIFIVAALLTPPDPVSQLAMAIPLFILYEISIVITKVFGVKPAKASKAGSQEEAADIYQ